MSVLNTRLPQPGAEIDRKWAVRLVSTLEIILRNLSNSASTTPYQMSNVTEDYVLDADSTTLDEVADVLGTLITDLKSKGVVS